MPDCCRLQFVFSIAACVLISGSSPLVVGAETSEKPTISENLTESARLVENRGDQAALLKARKQLEQRQYPAAFGTIQSLLDQNRDSFVSTDGRYVSLKSAANRLLSTLPASARRDYRKRFETNASSLLRAAIHSGDELAIRQLAVRYRHTIAGRDALRQLAALHFDRSRFSDAAACYLAVFEHPLSNANVRAKAVAGLMSAWIRSESTGHARRWFNQFGKEFETRPIVIAGQPMTLGTWVQTVLDEESARKNRAHSPLVNGGITTSSHPKISMPSLLPDWQLHVGSPPGIKGLIKRSRLRMEAYGFVDLPSFSPLIVKDIVLARTLDELIAVSVDTGTIRWRRSVGGETTRLSSNLKLLQNSGFHEIISDHLMYRIQSDTLYGRMSGDGTHVFAVVEGVNTPQNSRATNRIRNSATAGQFGRTQNELLAFSVADGRELWRIKPSTRLTRKDSQPSGKSLFLGPPLPVGSTLYTVIQLDNDIRLLALDAATGDLNWDLSLADVSGKPSSDRRQPGIPCPVAIDGNTLVCPTAAGAIIAVDLATRRWRWAYRFERDDIEKAKGLPPGRLNQRSQTRWWEGWRDPVTLLQNGRVVVSTPESDAIHVLDLKTGRRLWKRNIVQGLFVAGVTETQVIAVEKHRVRSLKIKTGKELWSAETGTASGRGVFSLTHYYLPVAGGRIAEINLENGTFQTSMISSENSLGNLVATSNSFVAQSPDRLLRFPFLKDALSAAKRRTDSGRSAIIHTALLDHQAGNFAIAIRNLQELRSVDNTAEVREQLRETLFAKLLVHPKQIDPVSVTLEPLLENTDDRIRFLRETAAAHRINGSGPKTLEVYLRLLELNPRGNVTISTTPKRVARLDRHIQGQILDLFAVADDSERPQLATIMNSRLQQSLGSQDPFALQRFADQFGHLKWGRMVRSKLAAKSNLGIGFLKSQLNLMELSRQSDSHLAANSLLQLAQLMKSHSYRVDAANHYRRLRDEFADIQFEEGSSVRAHLSELSKEPKFAAQIENGSPDIWPSTEPEIKVQQRPNARLDFSRLPILAAPGSLYDRLSVSVDSDGNRVRFQGDRQRSYWELALPKTSSPFRVWAPLHRGWGIGHLLVLQIGTELFGISALDENGEPRAKRLWQIETRGDHTIRPASGGIRVIPAQLGFGVNQVRILDPFGWELGKVGPVRPGYLCFHDRGQIIAVETTTGGRLWKRSDIPTETISSGDDDFVILSQPESSRLEILRAIDGKTVEIREQKTPAETIVIRTGRFGLVETAIENQRQYEQIDLVQGTPLWKRRFENSTIPFAIDQKLFGLLEPDGHLHVVSLSTGKTIQLHTVTVPKKLTRIDAVCDSSRIYIALSGGFENAANLRVSRERSSFRDVMINGTLYGLDRLTGDMLWQSALRDATLPLDQPKETPFLVLNYWQTAKPQNKQAVVGVIACFDKRTGREFYKTDPKGPSALKGSVAHSLETNIDHGWIDLNTLTQTVRFQYPN